MASAPPNSSFEDQEKSEIRPGLRPEDFECGIPLRGGAEVEHSLLLARDGMSAFGNLFENYRDYLIAVARAEISPDLAAKVSPSDVVQDTFTQAIRDFPRFTGSTEAEFKAWLKQILLHNFLDLVKRYKGTAMRNVLKEVAFDSGVNELPHSQDSPSSIVAANEQLERFREELRHLTAEQQRVIELRSIEGWPFSKIGEELNKSPDSVRKVWVRAIESLSERLRPNDESSSG